MVIDRIVEMKKGMEVVLNLPLCFWNFEDFFISIMLFGRLDCIYIRNSLLLRCMELAATALGLFLCNFHSLLHCSKRATLTSQSRNPDKFLVPKNSGQRKQFIHQNEDCVRRSPGLYKVIPCLSTSRLGV